MINDPKFISNQNMSMDKTARAIMTNILRKGITQISCKWLLLNAVNRTALKYRASYGDTHPFDRKNPSTISYKWPSCRDPYFWATKRVVLCFPYPISWIRPHHRSTFQMPGRHHKGCHQSSHKTQSGCKLLSRCKIESQ